MVNLNARQCFMQCFNHCRAGTLTTLAPLLLLAATAAAQDYPAKLVRIIVPTSAGGSVDTYSRLVAREMQTAFGQTFIVENRPGATGVIGSELAKRAAPDGYTLMFSSNTTHVLGPLPREPRPFDAVADFTSISKLLRYPLLLLVHPSVPVHTLNEFIALAKARPGQLVYSSAGLASMSHVAAELFTHAAGIKAIHSPYKGPTPAVQAVAGGEAHFFFNNIGSTQALIAAGKLRGLSVTGEKRSPALPQMPTMAEQGLRGFENVNTWVGSFAPANLPPPLLNKLSAEITRIMRTPEMEKRLAHDGYVLVANTPAQFKNEIQSEVETWSRVVRERGIKAE